MQHEIVFVLRLLVTNGALEFRLHAALETHMSIETVRPGVGVSTSIAGVGSTSTSSATATASTSTDSSSCTTAASATAPIPCH